LEAEHWEDTANKYFCPYRDSWISHGYEKHFMMDNRIDDYMALEEIDRIKGL
jgi:hypothetical protein